MGKFLIERLDKQKEILLGVYDVQRKLRKLDHKVSTQEKNLAYLEFMC